MSGTAFQSNPVRVARSSDDDVQDYLLFCDYLKESSGITLGENKAYLVKNRLRPILQAHQVESLGEATKKIKSGADPKLKLEIIDAMTTNETSWFRDQYPFEYLRDELLPKLTGKRMSTPRIWSAACSYGHEAYSMSMTIDEYMMKNPGSFPVDVQIVGTDISTRVVKAATAAEYDRLSMARGLSEERKKRYFIKTSEESYKLNEKIKRRVRFQHLNLLESFATMGKFDIIFCRNVLIYFSNENKAEIMNKFAKCLHKDGVLVLGASESVTSHSAAFEMVKCPRGVVYKPK